MNDGCPDDHPYARLGEGGAPRRGSGDKCDHHSREAGSWHSLTGAALEPKAEEAVQSSSETGVQRAERWVKWRAWEGSGR